MGNKIKSYINEKWVNVDFGSPTKTCTYQISNFGRIKSINKESKKENILRGAKVRGGLRVLNTKLKDNSIGCIYVHKFVASHFTKKSSGEEELIIHKDYDIDNNKWNNLEWVTEENWKNYIDKKPSVVKGREKRKKNYKLNSTKVALMKRMLAKGKTKRKIIAKNFGVSERHVKRIEDGIYWPDVKAAEEAKKKSSKRKDDSEK